jgi:hypothetical protein
LRGFGAEEDLQEVWYAQQQQIRGSRYSRGLREGRSRKAAAAATGEYILLLHSTIASATQLLLSLKTAAAAAASAFTACAPTSDPAVESAGADASVADSRAAAAAAEATGDGLSPTRPANSSEDSNNRAVRTAASSGTDMRLRVFSCNEAREGEGETRVG